MACGMEASVHELLLVDKHHNRVAQGKQILPLSHCHAGWCPFPAPDKVSEELPSEYHKMEKEEIEGFGHMWHKPRFNLRHVL